MSFRLVTWNINSIRLRLPLLEKLVNEHNPDVIGLQECKAQNDDFPFDDIHTLGYEHIHYWGMKGYNGTALLSKTPIDDPKIYTRCGKDDTRHISGIIKGVTVHNLYIPAGGYEPKPDTNPSFQHKLDFIDEMTEWFSQHHSKNDKLVLIGDLNVAPFAEDVWDHKKMVNVVSHTPMEVSRFTKMREALDWIDVMREHVPMDQKLYSWWSYRAKDWAASDRGRRLDHVWVTQPLKSAHQSITVLKEARSWERPSDHVPVIVDFDL